MCNDYYNGYLTTIRTRLLIAFSMIKLVSFLSPATSLTRRATFVPRGHTHILERRYASTQKNLPLLQHYKQLHGHLNVPATFIVPEDKSWPEEHWNKKLGQVVTSLRNRQPVLSPSIIDKLDDLGFVWNANEKVWREESLPALQTFKQIFGHMKVPVRFVVPATHDWPASTHGIRLGTMTSRLRQQRHRLREDQLQELDNIGFIWDLKKFTFFECILPSLRVYCQLHGLVTTMRQTFVVPIDDDQWPRATWGMKLGATLHRMKCGDTYAEFVMKNMEELTSMGFSRTASAKADKDEAQTLSSAEVETLLLGTKVFRRLEGHTLMNSKFVVPDSDSEWPSKLSGFSIGKLAHRARHLHKKGKLTPDIIAQLDAENFAWSNNFLKYKTFPLLENYYRIHKNLQVNQSFVIPENDTNWPRPTWGIKLGIAVNDMRRRRSKKKTDPIIQERLKEMGFIWDTSLHHWTVNVYPALKHFVKVYGHCNIPHAFIIPHDTSQWPNKNVHGYNLGRALYNLKTNMYFTDIPDEHRRDLQDLGFMLSITSIKETN